MSIACRIVGASLMLLLLPVHAAAAQARLSLSEAVDRARAQHPRIEAARAASDAAASRTEQAGKWANPHVLVYQESFPGATPDIDQIIVTATQRIRIGGQRGLAQSSAQALQDATTAEVSLTIEQLTLAAQQTYVDLFRMQESSRALDEAQRTADRLLRDLDVRVQEGDASRFDLLRMGLAAEGLAAQRARLRAELAAVAERLSFLIGGDVPAGGWILDDPVGAAFGPPPVEEAMTVGVPMASSPPASAPTAQVVAERFDAQALQFRGQAALSSAEAAGKEAIPDLVATLGYTRLDPASDGFVWSIGVDIPLFDTNGAEKAARLAEARRLDRERDVLLAEAGAASRAAAAEFEQLSSALSSLRQTAGPGQLLPIATTAYEEGEITVTGLLDAARAELDARLRELELAWARADAWFRWRFESGRYVGGTQ